MKLETFPHMKEAKNPWNTLETSEIYSNPWIKLREDKVITPAGTNGIYGVVEFHNYALGIIPIDKDGDTWLVGQYRYPLEEYSWEIPMGGGLLENDILKSAKRELLEETGIRAKKWTELLKIHTSNSVTNETGYAFIAENLEFGDSQPEPTEELQIKKLPFEEAVEWVINGQITDSLSIAAIMKYELIRKKV